MFNKLLDHLDFLWAEADLNMGLSVVRTTGSGQNWAPDRPAAVRSASTGIHKIQKIVKKTSVVDPNTLNLDPDQGLYYQF